MDFVSLSGKESGERRDSGLQERGNDFTGSQVFCYKWVRYMYVHERQHINATTPPKPFRAFHQQHIQPNKTRNIKAIWLIPATPMFLEGWFVKQEDVDKPLQRLEGTAWWTGLSLPTLSSERRSAAQRATTWKLWHHGIPCCYSHQRTTRQHYPAWWKFALLF